MQNSGNVQNESTLAKIGSPAMHLNAIVALGTTIFLALSWLLYVAGQKQLSSTQAPLAVEINRSRQPVTGLTTIAVTKSEPVSPPSSVPTPAPVAVEPDLSQIRAEIRAQYDDLDSTMVHEGVEGAFTKMASDGKMITPEGHTFTVNEMKDLLKGSSEKLALIGGTAKIEEQKTALQSVTPQSDGTVVAEATMKQIQVFQVPNRPRDETTIFEQRVDTWKQDAGKWTIIRSESRR